MTDSKMATDLEGLRLALERETELRRAAERHVRDLQASLEAAPYPSDVVSLQLALEESERARDSLRLEAQAVEFTRVRDNEYLIGQRDKLATALKTLYDAAMFVEQDLALERALDQAYSALDAYRQATSI